MASSSTGSEGTDEVADEIPEDLVLSWTRDATTINTFGTVVENDRQLLEELIQCVHKEKDANATKQKLSVLLGTGKDRKSVVIRARVLTKLIAIALGLHPDDIVTDSETGKESLRPSVDFQTALHPRLFAALQDDNSVLSYLFKDALEADDEVMTVIFCDPRFFGMYPVPYFHGCNIAVLRKISKLWLSQAIRRGFYYSTVLEPLFNQVKEKQLKRKETPHKISVKEKQLKRKEIPHKISVKDKQLKRKETPDKISEENLFKAVMMLCELLQSRTVKAGARLLEVMLSFFNDKEYTVLTDTTDRVRDLVKGLVIPLLALKNSKFRKCFLGNFQNWGQEERWHLQGSDRVLGPFGQSITVGPSSAQTDSNLLCWAARRGYSNLIRCISLGYTEARQMSFNENLLDDATKALGINLMWKVALWCATRHGQGLVIIELTRPSWVKNIDFNDYTRIGGCLPPLHLVSLLGDRSLLRILCMGEVGIEFGAYKTDYLGKTPLDYAMQFQLTTKNFKEGVNITNDIKDGMQFQAPNNEFKEWLQLHPNARYSTTEPNNYPTTRPYNNLTTRPHDKSYDIRCLQYPTVYNGRMLIPTLGYQSCIQQLLEMPGVVDRLKELNAMYTTQANFVLVGAALIASLAFVGWLQPPLGYTDYFQFTSSSPPAPVGTYKQYIAVEGHLSVHMFVAFNTLSFFLGIGTMLIGAEAALFVHDDDERTIGLKKVQKAIKWMLGFFITSMVCILAAFICAGLAILPPIQRLEWSMIVSLCLGACICLIPLTGILFSLAKDQIVKLKDQMIKFIMPFNKEKKLDDFLKDLGGSLVDGEDMKTLQDEKGKKCCE